MTLKTLKTLAALGSGALALAAPGAHAQDYARVISSVPLVQQVAVPRQVCTTQQVMVERPNSGGGAFIGAIAGGAIGNSIGHGSGRAAATMIGAISGAMVGNQIEGSPGYRLQDRTTCATRTTYESRTVGYNVTYEYAGRHYQVQTTEDPGYTIRVQVAPQVERVHAYPPAVVYSTQVFEPEPRGRGHRFHHGHHGHRWEPTQPPRIWD